jgi:hypothetical protein
MAWGVRILCGERVGTGAPITPRLVLTCEHVVRGHRRATVRSATGELLAFEVVDADADLDVALLRASTTPLPAAASLTLRALWRGAPLLGGRAVLASCTAEPDTLRSIDVELRPAPPASRRVQFGVLAARDGVRPGYSGAPVVELDMRSSTPRAVGLVRARDRDSLDVLDRAGAGWLVPTERIAERFAEVACLVETPVQRDAAWESHWEPRSRGVAASTEPGFFFTGRKAAYERVREHLDADAGGLLVVTGQRGHGKSSLLARAVALATARYVATLGPHAAHALAGDTPPIRLDAATVARGRSVATVADELALQLGVLADGAQQLVAACERDRLAPRIVIDAVDESIDPGALMRELVVGLAGAGASIAIGAVAGRVRLDAPQGTGWLDLDDPRYGDDAIPQYVERRLLATGRYEVATARILSRAVARRARANFLVAELVARSLVHRPMPLDTRSPHWVDALPGDVTDAFRDYLARFGDQRERVLALLHPLAHARGDGLTLDPPDAWLAAANALRPDTMAPFEHADLRRACGLASDYLISSSDGGARRLYHEGLASAIRGLSAQTRAAHPSRPSTAAAITSRRLADARSFVDALCGLLPADRAAAAEAYRGLDPYLLRHLPTHLGEHGRVEELLDRPGLLLCAEQAALRGALVRGALAVPAAREQIRAGLVHALARPQADAARRAAAACAAMRRQHERETERRLRLAWSTRIGVLAGRAAASDPESAARVGAATALPYESISAPRLALTVCTIPNADPAYYAGIGAVAAIEHEGEPLILSAGSAGLRSWRLDGAPGELAQPGHHHAVALAWHDGEPLVIAALGATPGEPTLCGWRLDGTAATGTADGTITTARDIGKLAALALDGEPLVVTASGSTIRSWRLDGSPGGLPVLQSPSKFVTGLSMTSHDGRPLVVCGGDDGAIRSWYVDGAPGPLHGEHGAWIQALVTLEHEGSPLVVAGGIGGALRSWRVDGAPGPLALQLDVRGIRALAVGTVGGDPIVITAGGDGHLLSWYPDGSPGPFAHIDHHEGTAETLAVYDDPENPLLISVDHDASISAWRLSGAPATREREDARAYQLETSVALRPELSAELASHIAWRLGRARRADIAPDAAHGYRLMAIAVTEHDGDRSSSAPAATTSDPTSP